MPNPSQQQLHERSVELCQAFNPDDFVTQANEATRILHDHLSTAFSRQRKVWSGESPDDLLARWPAPDDDTPVELPTLLRNIANDSTAQHHPGFVGQQISMPPLSAGPIAMVSAVLNNSSAIFEGAPVAIAMEHRVISWMKQMVGYGDDSGGVLTSGGTLGALTAILAMRQDKVGNDAWENGISSDNNVAIFVSEQSHYCNSRACAVAGMGQKSAIPIATDDQFRMNLNSLASRFETAIKKGKQPIAVVANAGSTATGSHDDLNAIADFCEQRKLWFHVDAAHGGSALLSPRLAPMLRGIHRADSIVWDAHKMMLMPSLCTAVLVKNADTLDAAFRQNAAYLLSDVAMPWHQPASRNFETTKPTMVLPLYCTLRTFGPKFFRQVVEYAHDMAQFFADQLEHRDEFEYLIRPASNIVCFRRIVDDNQSDSAQLALREQVNRNGRFFIMRTTLRGRVWLRIVLMNPATTPDDLTKLLDELSGPIPGD